jgi:hypothetical protein
MVLLAPLLCGEAVCVATRKGGSEVMSRSVKLYRASLVVFVAGYVNGILSAHSDGKHPYYTTFYAIAAGVLGLTAIVLLWSGLYYQFRKYQDEERKSRY